VQLASGESGYVSAAALGQPLSVRHPADVRAIANDDAASPRDRPQQP
jgi:hypothetical protein